MYVCVFRSNGRAGKPVALPRRGDKSDGYQDSSQTGPLLPPVERVRGRGRGRGSGRGRKLRGRGRRKRAREGERRKKERERERY